jgi:hypothetical protein
MEKPTALQLVGAPPIPVLRGPAARGNHGAECRVTLTKKSIVIAIGIDGGQGIRSDFLPALVLGESLLQDHEALMAEHRDGINQALPGLRPGQFLYYIFFLFTEARKMLHFFIEPRADVPKTMSRKGRAGHL